MSLNWQGVFPAITTPFREDGSIDHNFLHRHANWMLGAGCHGIIPCGSLGEGATLSFDEKIAVMKTCVEASAGKPVIPGIAALSTQEAVRLAKAAEDNGCRGLMVLPPYAYSTDWREMKAHVVAVMKATKLPCILYNNPVAYKTDFLPEQVAELAEEIDNMEAVKESSTDVRRVTSIAALTNRITILVGVDDAIVEGIAAGAKGWVAGLVNAFPDESVAVWKLALEGKTAQATDIYRWFLPMLRLDTVPKFVQLIKLAQQMVGMGSERVRPPRLELIGAERDDAVAIIREGIARRPSI
ncbi:MAG TPA: dihydrodipicolinate synthase family protein [Fimbriimonadaceae bacterium]|nr:dihydrodipicolinate synthase family protein [Fimbriimonadaceae bacterium]